MHIKKRINLKRYFGLSLIPTILIILYFRETAMTVAVLLVYIATIINQACLIEIVEEMSTASVPNHDGSLPKKMDKFWLVQLGVVKLLVLIGALTLGVLFIGNRIIIPLINYVIIIFILGTSLKTRTTKNA
jgi:hypothetical protein